MVHTFSDLQNCSAVLKQFAKLFCGFETICMKQFAKLFCCKDAKIYIKSPSN